MSLTDRVGPLFGRIHLEITRRRSFRPTYAVHNLCAGHPSILLSLTKEYRDIKPNTYEEEYQKVAKSLIDQGFAIPLVGDLRIDEIIAIYEKFFCEEKFVYNVIVQRGQLKSWFPEPELLNMVLRIRKKARNYEERRYKL